MVATIQHLNHAERIRRIRERYEQRVTASYRAVDLVFGVIPIAGTAEAEVPRMFVDIIPSEMLRFASEGATATGCIVVAKTDDHRRTARLYYATRSRSICYESEVTHRNGIETLGKWKRIPSMAWMKNLFKSEKEKCPPPPSPEDSKRI